MIEVLMHNDRIRIRPIGGTKIDRVNLAHLFKEYKMCDKCKDKFVGMRLSHPLWDMTGFDGPLGAIDVDKEFNAILNRMYAPKVPTERRLVTRDGTVVGENFFIYCPGVEKKDISIEKKGDYLYIKITSAPVKAVDENGKEVVFTNPEVKLDFLLRKGTNGDAFSAKLENGLLTIVTRLLGEAQDKTIKIA